MQQDWPLRLAAVERSRWKARTGDHALQLRALALSDRFDAAMDKLLSRRRTAVRRIA